MARWGYPVVYDATHSVQLSGGLGTTSGGQLEFIRPLARAAVAVGVDSFLMAVHEEPGGAKSDRCHSSPFLSELETLLCDLLALDEVVKPPLKVLERLCDVKPDAGVALETESGRVILLFGR